MQLLLLGMIAAVFMHDDVLSRGPDPFLPVHPALTLAAVLATKLAVTLPLAHYVRQTLKQLGQPKGRRTLRRLERLLGAAPLLLLAGFVTDLALGWLTLVRDVTGNVVLLDELLALTPTLLAALLHWWLHYPVDRRLRDAAIMRRADQGLPIYPVWTRRQYVWTQARHQIGIILAPLILILAWSEAVEWFALRGHLTLTTALWLTPLGAGVVFLFSPPLLRRVFDTAPLPPGTVRDALADLCDQYRVGVRDLLLWRTGGHVINAAVMGLVAPLRYVLMTDGLLDQLHRPHVEAVMAHELGHVKHRHLVWLILAAGAWMAVLFAGADAVFLHVSDAGWVQGLAVTLALVLWALGFGWVSRRVERQADTFAAKHMSRSASTHESPPTDEPPSSPATAFTGGGVLQVVEALQCVADLNHISTRRPSWRHGSIARRQAYLTTLIGRPLNQADVDQTMKLIQAATLLIIATLIAWAVWGG